MEHWQTEREMSYAPKWWLKSRGEADQTPIVPLSLHHSLTQSRRSGLESPIASRCQPVCDLRQAPPELAQLEPPRHFRLAICNDFVDHHDISYFTHTRINLASFSDYEPELHNLSNHFLEPELLELPNRTLAQRSTPENNLGSLTQSVGPSASLSCLQ